MSAGCFRAEMMCRCRINMCSQSQEVRHTSCGAHVLDFIDIKAIDTHNHFPRNLHTVAIRTRRRLACVSGTLQARWFLGKTHVMGRASLLAVKTGFSWEGRGGEERGGARYRLSLSIGQSEKEQGSSKRKENHQFASFFSPKLNKPH